MRLPKINHIVTQTQPLTYFSGLNCADQIADGEMRDMRNMSSDGYPSLSTITGRYVLSKDFGNVQAMALMDKTLYWIRDGVLYAGPGNPQASLTSGTATNLKNLTAIGEKKIVKMGAYLIILPDKAWFNTSNGESGYVETFARTSNAMTFDLCDKDGNVYDIKYISEPSSPSEGELWLDKRTFPATLKQYSSASGTWVEISLLYTKISCGWYDRDSAIIDCPFEVGDSVTVSGLKGASLVGPDGVDVRLDIEGNYIVSYVEGNTIVINARISNNKIVVVNAGAIFERKMPTMDFVIESGNRLWGCRSGYDSTTKKHLNEIYASKLGDFKNWNCFAGISTDSYVASVGTDGPFTGAIAHQGHPIFLKERYMHKVYGSVPSEFQITSSGVTGVQVGSANSLAIVNEVLYYKGRSGIFAYDGSMPQLISDKLGKTTYDSANGFQVGSKYYISMRDTNTQKWSLFVFDTTRGFWHKEDDLNLYMAVSNGEDVMYVEDGVAMSLNGTFALPQERKIFDWYVESGRIGLDISNKKSLSKISILYELDANASASLYTRTDASDSWKFVATLPSGDHGRNGITLTPGRANYFQYRIEGTGKAKIYNITKYFTIRSDNPR